MSYLIMPVQRIPRYELLLRELDKHTLSTHPEKASLRGAIDAIHGIAIKINEGKRHAENMSQLLQLQASIRSLPEPLMLPHRLLLRCGILRKSDDVASFKCVLLNDMLLWTDTTNEYKGRFVFEPSTQCNALSIGFTKTQGFSLENSDSALTWICANSEEAAAWQKSVEDALSWRQRAVCTQAAATSPTSHATVQNAVALATAALFGALGGSGTRDGSTD